MPLIAMILPMHAGPLGRHGRRTRQSPVRARGRVRGVRSRPPRDRRAVVPLRRLRRRARVELGPFTLETEHGLDALAGADTVIVPACDPDIGRTPELIDALRAAYERGARLVAFCSGAFALGGGRRARQPPRDDALDACGTPRGRVPDRRRATRRPLRRRRSSAHVRGNVRGDRPVAPHRAAGLQHRDRDLRRAAA